MSFRAANLMQVASNWLLGWRIVEQEQHGEKRAAYGKHIIEIASKAMTEKFGQGFSETTLRAYRKFYQEFPLLQIQRALPAEFNSKIEEIQRPLLAEFKLSRNELVANGQPMLPQLSWMHYERLMRVADKKCPEMVFGRGRTGTMGLPNTQAQHRLTILLPSASNASNESSGGGNRNEKTYSIVREGKIRLCEKSLARGVFGAESKYCLY